jgi:CO/xanthine dehydrogenase FAD-binding subunit
MVQWKYAAPSTLPEVLLVLSDVTPQMYPLAGGTHMLVHLRQGVVQPGALVDLRRLEDLRQVHLQAQTVQIGALVTIAQLERNEVVQEHVPLLCSMASLFGNPLIRSAATLGGNIASARVGIADAVVPLCALNATLVLQHAHAEQRTVNIADYILQEPDPCELITGISVPVQQRDSFSFYSKINNRQAGAAAIASIAANLAFHENRVTEASLVLGALTRQPFHMRRVEALLRGTPLPFQEDLLAQCETVFEQEWPEPLAAIRGPAAYRAALGSALVRKALQQMSADYEKEL